MSHYCYRCGTKLETKVMENRQREVCAACGWVHYPQLKVSAAALIEIDGKILLAKRKNMPWEGYWYLPAGYVEADEDPYRAAERELCEETGLKATAQYIREMYFFNDDPRGNGLLLVVVCSLTGGRLVETDEVELGKFFSPSELPAPLAGAGHDRAVTDWYFAHSREL